MALAKVRALHPDFFSDDDLAEVSIAARLLFAGMWCFACDNGHLRDRSKQIKRWVFATDDVNVADLLRELADAEGDLIVRSDGWIVIPGLAKRQRIDWRYFKTCERTGCEKPAKKAKEPDSEPETLRGHASTLRESEPRAPKPATDGDGDGDGDGDSRSTVRRPGATPALIPVAAATAAAVTQAAEDFDAFWDTYPRKVGKPKARSAWIKAAKTTRPADILSGAIRYRDDPNRTDAFTAHPTTWLNRAGWNDEPLPTRMPSGRNNERTALFERQMERAIERERQMGIQ